LDTKFGTKTAFSKQNQSKQYKPSASHFDIKYSKK